ncbi:hypothetical protein PWT90_04023 [Aphanocladium album]|nr:hypothetical protein PWT90_04023 [Aphanocladium album]
MDADSRDLARLPSYETPVTQYYTAPEDTGPLNLASDESGRQRQKRWTTRSRTGCLTCRSRRIKCDEAKPVCTQCSKSNRPCLSSSSQAPLGLSPPVLPRPQAWSDLDVRLDQYFIASISSIACDEFNHDFWQHYVLQARAALPAVRHASNALACLKWTRNSNANLDYTFKKFLETESGRNYSLSIKQIFDIMQAPSPSPEEKTTVLVASIFYYRYALNWDSIWGVITKSCQLIRLWKYWECLDSGHISSLASQVLYYFVKAQRAFEESFCVTRKQTTSNSWLEAILWLQAKPPTYAMHAYLEMEMLYMSLRGIMEGLPFRPSKIQVEAAATERRALHNCFQKWDERFQSTAHPLPPQYRIHAAVVNVRRALVDILFQINLQKFYNQWSETCWDDFDHDFAQALGLIESILAEACDITTQAYRDIHYTPSLYKSLIFIARFCRKSALRHRAVDIVHAAMTNALARSYVTNIQSPRDKSPLVNTLNVDKLIALEESAWTNENAGAECSTSKRCIRNEFVCNMHRVARVSFWPEQDKSADRFQFSTVADITHGRKGQQYHIRRVMVF